MHRRAWPASAVVLLVLLLAPSASAVVRHASPTGDETTSGCTDTEPPCSLQRAVETVAAPGDEVILAAGTYIVSAALVVNKGIDIHGAAGQAPPRVLNAGPGVFNLTVTGIRLADVQLEAPGAVVRTSGLNPGSGLLERITVLAGPAASGRAVELNRGWLLRDSIVHTTATDGRAIYAGGGTGTRSRAVNVTAIATDGGGVALEVNSGVGGLCVPPFDQEFHATNIIARGGLYDLSVPDICQSGGGQPADQSLSIGHSNFRTARINHNPPRSRVESQGGNQEAEPIFAAPASLDFHQLDTSVTIDAGVQIPFLGTADIDREPRTVGSAPDIGADEYVPPPPPPPGPDTGEAGDVRAPVASLLAATPSTFRAARRGSSNSARRRAGTRVSYALDEAAAVSFTVRRAVRRRGRTRYVPVRGSFTDAGAVGGNTLRFTGRLRGRRLPPGRYRLAAKPTDAAGNVGPVARTAFRIVR